MRNLKYITMGNARKTKLAIKPLMDILDIQWIEVPEGNFLMGSVDEKENSLPNERPQQLVYLPAFYISRFPITSSQYNAFLRDGGYGNKWRHLWTNAGWEWLQIEPTRFLFPSEGNYPATHVSWYEATAFSRWLGCKLGREIGLPTEAQWEKAARGTDGRLYPWGNTFDSNKCNSYEGKRLQLTPVNAFPYGASPYGVEDMTGNAAEWCSTKWRPSYNTDADKDPTGEPARVWRGGSFHYSLRLVRCACRYGYYPYGRFDNLGFRVVAQERGVIE